MPQCNEKANTMGFNEETKQDIIKSLRALYKELASTAGCACCSACHGKDPSQKKAQPTQAVQDPCTCNHIKRPRDQDYSHDLQTVDGEPAIPPGFERTYFALPTPMPDFGPPKEVDGNFCCRCNCILSVEESVACARCCKRYHFDCAGFGCIPPYVGTTRWKCGICRKTSDEKLINNTATIKNTNELEELKQFLIVKIDHVEKKVNTIDGGFNQVSRDLKKLGYLIDGLSKSVGQKNICNDNNLDTLKNVVDEVATIKQGHCQLESSVCSMAGKVDLICRDLQKLEDNQELQAADTSDKITELKEITLQIVNLLKERNLVPDDRFDGTGRILKSNCTCIPDEGKRMSSPNRCRSPIGKVDPRTNYVKRDECIRNSLKQECCDMFEGKTLNSNNVENAEGKCCDQLIIDVAEENMCATSNIQVTCGTSDLPDERNEHTCSKPLQRKSESLRASRDRCSQSERRPKVIQCTAKAIPLRDSSDSMEELSIDENSSQLDTLIKKVEKESLFIKKIMCKPKKIRSKLVVLPKTHFTRCNDQRRRRSSLNGRNVVFSAEKRSGEDILSPEELANVYSQTEDTVSTVKKEEPKDECDLVSLPKKKSSLKKVCKSQTSVGKTNSTNIPCKGQPSSERGFTQSEKRSVDCGQNKPAEHDVSVQTAEKSDHSTCTDHEMTSVHQSTSQNNKKVRKGSLGKKSTKKEKKSNSFPNEELKPHKKKNSEGGKKTSFLNDKVRTITKSNDQKPLKRTSLNQEAPATIRRKSQGNKFPAFLSDNEAVKKKIDQRDSRKTSLNQETTASTKRKSLRDTYPTSSINNETVKKIGVDQETHRKIILNQETSPPIKPKSQRENYSTISAKNETTNKCSNQKKSGSFVSPKQGPEKSNGRSASITRKAEVVAMDNSNKSQNLTKNNIPVKVQIKAKPKKSVKVTRDSKDLNIQLPQKINDNKVIFKDNICDTQQQDHRPYSIVESRLEVTVSVENVNCECRSTDKCRCPNNNNGTRVPANVTANGKIFTKNNEKRKGSNGDREKQDTSQEKTNRKNCS